MRSSRTAGPGLPSRRKWEELKSVRKNRHRRTERRSLNWNETTPNAKAMLARTWERAKALMVSHGSTRAWSTLATASAIHQVETVRKRSICGGVRS
jgi:hypothetical protein